MWLTTRPPNGLHRGGRVKCADQVAEQPLHLTRQPGGSVPGPVGEGHHADAVVGREEDLGVEPGDHALVLHGGMSAQIDPPEREAHTRYPRVGLVVRLEHGGEGLGFEATPDSAGGTRIALLATRLACMSIATSRLPPLRSRPIPSAP